MRTWEGSRRTLTYFLRSLYQLIKQTFLKAGAGQQHIVMIEIIANAQDWKRSLFIPGSKKGNAKEGSNYLTIALISHASKVILKILQARLQQYCRLTVGADEGLTTVIEHDLLMIGAKFKADTGYSS